MAKIDRNAMKKISKEPEAKAEPQPMQVVENPPAPKEVVVPADIWFEIGEEARHIRNQKIMGAINKVKMLLQWKNFIN